MDYLEQQVKLQNSPPPTLAELRIQSVEEWVKIDRNYLKTLVASLPDRIHDVIKVRRGIDKYYWRNEIVNNAICILNTATTVYEKRR